MSEPRCEVCKQPIRPGEDCLYRGDTPCEHSPVVWCVLACKAEIARLTDAMALQREEDGDRISALTEDNRRLGAVVCQTGELTVELAETKEACRSYIDATITLGAELSEAREAARAMFRRATLGNDLFRTLERWPWLEE